jgi:hypothetical protein
MNNSAKQLWLLMALSVAMMALGLVWAGFETREFQEQLVWVKPFKFALSFVVFFATLALAVQWMGADAQDRRGMRAAVSVLAAAFWIEMIYITFQAAQGQGSHFNYSSAFHSAMYSIMGFGAFCLVAGAAAIGWAVWRDTDSKMNADLRLGVALGFGLSTGLTLITAFTLGAMGSHFVGVPADGAAVIPFFGWSAAVGDLRPAHFAALHAMQAIPLLALWRQGRAGARNWVIGGAAVYSAVTLALFVQALLGLPMIRL